ncbi:MAG: hypothetical protein AAF517_01635 [Planctomycetota bacterium]
MNPRSNSHRPHSQRPNENLLELLFAEPLHWVLQLLACVVGRILGLVTWIFRRKR